jgi:Flp pilus assembly protein TadD/outer membrane protein OmpA-like peptidoglycan-associated protein
MNKTSIKSLTMVAIAGSLAASCDLMKDVDYKITPSPLEMHGDSVRIKAEATFPEKGIKKKASAEITPTLGGTPLKTFTVLGEKATGNGTTIQYKPGGKVTYTDVIAYQPSFENADLQITGKVYKGAKEKKAIEPFTVAKGTIITPLLVRKDFKVAIIKDEFKRVLEFSQTAQINFDKAKSVLRPQELKDKDVKDLQAWFKAVEGNAKIAVKNVNVTGYASPEGEQGKNESLSTERSETGKTATLKIGKEAKNTASQTVNFSLAGKGEDWDGFKAELSKSTMNEDDKQLVLRVLEMYKDPVQREQEIRNMSKTFTYLEKNILPQLRRAEINVVYDKTGYSDEELVALSKTKIDTLTVEEILFTATLTTDVNEKLRLYKESERLFPNDYRTSNNVGVALYQLGKLDEAKAKFEKANSIKKNETSTNNLAAIAGAKGDRTGAKELLAKAGSSEEANYNRGILAIQDGNYDAAIKNLGKDNYNKALAQILNTNYGEALSTINNSADKETAQGYYLKAIIAARQDKLADIVENLKNAFAKDGALKAKAIKDMEFYKYMENAAFTAIVK